MIFDKLWEAIHKLEARVDALEISDQERDAVCLHQHVTNQGTFGAPELICEDCGESVDVS